MLLKNKFGETIFFSGSSIPVNTELIRSIFCKHDFRKYALETGGGWMSDNFDAEICSYCSKVKNLKKK